jgi:phosphonate dehydrogenase
MKKTVVITNRVHPDVIGFLSERCHVVANVADDPWDRRELAARVAEASAIMAFMNDCIGREFICGCPKLEIVAGVVKGHDNFDVVACTERGIWVSVVREALTSATAELTVALLLGLARHLLPGDAYVRRGYPGWRPIFYGKGVQNSTVGILGMGAIGLAVAERLRPFGCRLLAFDELGLGSANTDARSVTFEVLLRESDFVVVALPLDPRTYHLIDNHALHSMKPGAYLVNTARGSIVDEEAVADAIAEGHIAGYAADVFETEDCAIVPRPTTIAPRLLADTAHTLLTPHLGSAEGRVRRTGEMEMAASILDCFAGREPRGAVNDIRQRITGRA